VVKAARPGVTIIGEVGLLSSSTLLDYDRAGLPGVKVAVVRVDSGLGEPVMEFSPWWDNSRIELGYVAVDCVGGGVLIHPHHRAIDPDD
jgi:hypothetical protein